MQVIPNKYLSTNLNRLNAGPSSLLRAKNVRVDGERLRARNGQDLLNPEDPALIDIRPADYFYYRAAKIFFYNGKIWAYFINEVTSTNDVLAYFDESNNSWHASEMQDYNDTGFFEGYGEYPIQLFESNNRLLIMTKYGPYTSPKLKDEDYELQTVTRYAGAPPALPFNDMTSINTIGNFDADWLPEDAKVAYRHVWKYVDANGTEVYGAVSDSRQILNNAGAAADAVQLTIKIPVELLSGSGDIARMACEVYRTQTSIIGVNGVTPDPGDQMFFVAELRPTTADIAAGTMTFIDIITDSALQGPLYTNETQQGASSSRIRAPIAQAVAHYDGCAWYGNIKNRWSLPFELINVRDDGATTARGFSDGDIIGFGDIAIEFKDTASMSVNQSLIDNTTGYAFMFDRIIKTVQNAQKLYNEYDARPYFNLNTVSGPNQVSGTMVLQEMRDAIVPQTFKPYIGLYRSSGWPANVADNPSPIVPTPLVSEDKGYGHRITRIRSTGSGAPIEFDFSGTIDFVVNDVVNLSRPQYMQDLTLAAGSQGDGVQYFSPGQYKVSNIAVNTIQFTGLTHSGAAFNQQLGVAPFATTWAWLGMGYCIRDGADAYESQAVGKKQQNPGRVMHSAFQQPQNAPAINYYDIGSTDKQIIQMIPFGRFLYVFKQDGLYRVSGNYPAYSVQQFDPNVILSGKDLVATMGGSIYAWTSKGVYEITQTSSTRVSYDIQQDINVITTNNYSNLRRLGFAVGNEDDHSVTFWVPNYTISKSGNSSSSTNDIAFVFDGEGWTQRTDEAISGCTGIVDDGKVFLYTLKDTGNGWLTKQRRTGSAQDFADEGLAITLTDLIDSETVSISIQTDAADDLGASSIPIGSCIVMQGDWQLRGYVTSVTKTGVKTFDLGIEIPAQNGVPNVDVDWLPYFGLTGTMGLSFEMNWQYGINADQDPLIRKHFTDIGLIYQQPYFTSMDIGFSSDVRPNETYVSNSLLGFLQLNYDATRTPCALADNDLQDKVIRSLVATAHSRCSQLRVSLRHSRAFEYVSVYGYFVRTSSGGMNIERNNDASS